MAISIQKGIPLMTRLLAKPEGCSQEDICSYAFNEVPENWAKLCLKAGGENMIKKNVLVLVKHCSYRKTGCIFFQICQRTFVCLFVSLLPVAWMI